jgi:UDP-N-acetylmuramate: L-alanyl-gamma-D-glutamyl-meso-diaminopimelate ligase
VVIEGDEYDSAFFDKGPKFLHYRPHNVILTSVEFDHADIYRDLDHLKDAFRRLIDLIPGDGKLIVCRDYHAAMELAGGARSPVISYGDHNSADWSVRNVRFGAGKTFFDPCFRGQSDGSLEVGLIGRHNVLNALAVYILAKELGIRRDRLLEGFATFQGVKRRQEIRGEKRGVLVIDDFAHHPTAVRETIDAVRAAYPGRRLWAIFEPRSNTSRRSIFEQEFSESLALADHIVVSRLYQPEKIPEIERLSVDTVVREINHSCGDSRAVVIENAQDIATYVADHAVSGDIMLVMSNGGFDAVHDKILQALAGC